MISTVTSTRDSYLIKSPLIRDNLSVMVSLRCVLCCRLPVKKTLHLPITVTQILKFDNSDQQIVNILHFFMKIVADKWYLVGDADNKRLVSLYYSADGC